MDSLKIGRIPRERDSDTVVAEGEIGRGYGWPRGVLFGVLGDFDGGGEVAAADDDLTLSAGAFLAGTLDYGVADNLDGSDYHVGRY